MTFPDSSPVGFPSTLWTVIRQAGGAEAHPARRREALGALVERYWKPVYWYLRLSHDRDPATAMDLTQAFFLHVLESGFAAKASPDRGRFRAYLKVSVRNFVVNDALAAQAARRGGGAWALSLDEAERGAAELLAAGREGGAEHVFEREWRSAVVHGAAEALRKRLAADGKSVVFEAFRIHDLEGDEAVGYRDIAAKLGISETDVGNHLRTARELFRECVRAEVRETVGSAAELGEELRELFGEAG